MTTPKSPEQIMEEYRINLNKTAFIHGTAFTPGEAWLRSSMASLLCYMAERMPGMYLREDCDEMHCCSEEHDEPRVMHCHEHNDAVQECISLLEEEARKITNNG